MPPMGLSIGLSSGATCKRKFRWLMTIDEASGSAAGGGGSGGVVGDGASLLPPLKTSRPNLAFSELKINHLNETIYYPGKPDWRPINLTLYDTITTGGLHPVFEWIRRFYNPQSGDWRTVLGTNFLQTVRLQLFDGCGDVIEQWTYEEAWPSNVNFSEVNMADSGIVLCEITLRYARAYVGGSPLSGVGITGSGRSGLGPESGGPLSSFDIAAGGPGPPGGQPTIGSPRTSQSGNFGFAGGFGGLGSTSTSRIGRVGGTIQPSQGVPPQPEFMPNRS